MACFESYLTECSSAGLREVRIVHGKGTGTLRVYPAYVRVNAAMGPGC